MTRQRVNCTKFLAIPVIERKIDAISIPQKIKKRFLHLSAINPKTGCIIEEKSCEMLNAQVAIPSVIPIFATINGKIGLINPE